VIEIKELCKLYGDKKALNRVSFDVREGEILGFLGPNGAGKTTTMNIITGYLSATSGKVLIDGHDILEEPLLAKKLIGYLPEQPPLYLDMTVLEYLRFISDLKKVPRSIREKQIHEIMALVKLSEASKRMIHNLSKGYRQRVGLAQALIGKPKILIFDEPTVGLDPKQIIEIRMLLKLLSKEHTIIMSSHIISEIQAVCDRVIIINAGRIVAIDTPIELSKRLSDQSKLSITLGSTDIDIEQALRSVSGVSAVTMLRSDNGISQFDLTADSKIDVRRDVFFLMASNSWPILEFRSLDPSLEDIYLNVTSHDKKKRSQI
jgi:ABC-2 type transport system ATP-binding protein